MSKQPRLHMRVAALTHVGLRRRANEDCIAVGSRIMSEPMAEPWLSVEALDPCCPCLVADGMGGHPAGEVASRAAVEAMLCGLKQRPPDAGGLAGVLQDTNAFLFSEMARCPQWYGMGTTLAGIAACPERVIAFNVGDSRIYRVEDGRVRQLSIDDCESVGTGFLFNRTPMRVLSQCLGGFPDTSEIAPHLVELPVVEGSQFLICSDGVYDMLSDAAIAQCLDADPVRSVQAIFEAAMNEGGIDNISIVLARMEAADARRPAEPAPRR